jgi:DNA-binding PadR family transcriptional regulator
MNEQALLLLGILRTQSQHGYQINEFIERNLSRITNMKKATAYAILERLAKAGYVSVYNEQEGNRPVRKVYSITPTGEVKYLELLRANLASAEPMTFAGDVGLMLLDDLPLPEVETLLKQRLEQLESQLEVFKQVPTHTGLGVNLALEHQEAMLRAEQSWLSGVLLRFHDTVAQLQESKKAG